jgi:hypothetical protein
MGTYGRCGCCRSLLSPFLTLWMQTSRMKGQCWSLAQLVGLTWSAGVIAGRRGCCTLLPGDQLIPLTRNEIRRLFTGLCQQPSAPRSQLRWSRWRRRHQATARACYYRQRTLAPR